MQSALTRLRHVSLAMDQDSDLITNILKTVEDLAVAIHKVENRVGNTGFGAKLPDQDLSLAEVVSWKSGEQVVNSLELESTVDEIEPSRAINVHAGSELPLGEGLGFAKIRCRHTPMRQSDLNVKGHGDDVRDENKGNASRPVGQGSPQEEISEDEPVAAHEADFRRSNPPRLAVTQR